VFVGTLTSWRLSFNKKNLSGVKCSLINFKESDRLLFVAYTVNFSLLLTLLQFNNTDTAFNTIDLVCVDEECNWTEEMLYSYLLSKWNLQKARIVKLPDCY